ncbi:MAG: hypothetical protein ACXV2F_06720 [Halobacteriota archaeon]
MHENKDSVTPLDDLSRIQRLDQSDMYPYMTTMGDDTLRSYVSAKEKLVISTDNIHHIVGAGMGGSGQPVFAASSLLNRELRLPIVSSQT